MSAETRGLMFSLKSMLGRFARPDPGVTTNLSPLMSRIDPSALAPPSALHRLGTAYGGWIIPADCGLSEDSVCYLAGAGEDISFDCQLARRYRCRIRIIDPTPRAVAHFGQLEQAVKEGRRFPINKSETEFYDVTPADLARMSLLPVGLADQDVELKFYMPRNPEHVSCSTANLHNTEEYFTAQCHRLSTVMAQQRDARVDLLKMDIEGAEYAVIRDIVRSNLLPRLLLIEFDEVHSPKDERAASRIGEHVDLLVRSGMQCIAVEGSNMTLQREGSGLT
jgi:FkbM family methyltransferase